MKLTYTTKDGRMTVELEAANDKDMFRKLARFQEIYEDLPAAEVNGKRAEGGDVVYRVRKSKYIDEKKKEKEAEYFEKVVVSGPLTWFKKGYGVLDDGTENLFPRRMSQDDPNYSKHIHGYNGWSKYVGLNDDTP
jgi:hypothetical protein